ncbi:MAG TPA: hypothetical protein VGJ22_12230 [Anaerolineales bacterium]
MKRKFLSSIGLALILMLALTGTAFAAPALEEATPITGTVQSITLETDATTGETTVVVDVLDDLGATQTVRLTVDDAVSLGLVTLDPAGEPVVNDAAIGEPIEIDPALVITDEVTEEAQHPVALILSEFFGVDYDTVMSVHEDGVGFGVIAQALWMSQALGGGSEMFETIVDAKKNHDYSGIEMPDGSTPKNWGEFKKALEQGENLGQIMSGHAESDEEGSDEALTTATSENGTTHGQQNTGHGHGKGHGKKK